MMSLFPRLLPVLLLLLCSVQPAMAGDPGGLLRRFQAASEHTTTLVTDFRQEKTLALLNDTLISSGRMCLHQEGDNRVLLWEYTSPSISGFLFDNGTFSVWTRDRASRHPASGNENKALRAMSEQILAWLRADIPALERQYRLEYLAPDDRHASEGLRLYPRNGTRVFSSLEVRFSPAMDSLSELVLTEAQGDFTRLLFTHTKRNAPLPDACTP